MTQITPPAAESVGEDAWRTPPRSRPVLTMRDRLAAIEQMGRRLNGYVEFMCRVESMPGSSAEAKANAVAAFHDRMVALDVQLERIHNDLRLG